MTVSKAKTTKAKAVKTTTSKAVATEPSPATEHVVSTVTITPEAAPVVATPAVTAPVVTALVPAPAATAVAVVTAQQVAERAYEIWQSVSYEHGHDVEHWLAAEKELKQAVKQ